MKPADYLLVDVGNGRTKFALATREHILTQDDTPTATLSSAHLRTLLESWLFDRVIVSSVAIVGANVLVDAAYARLDPRVGHSRP